MQHEAVKIVREREKVAKQRRHEREDVAKQLQRKRTKQETQHKLELINQINDEATLAMKKLALTKPLPYANYMVVRTGIGRFWRKKVVWFMGYDSNCYLGSDHRIYRSKWGRFVERYYVVVKLHKQESSKLKKIRDDLRKLAA